MPSEERVMRAREWIARHYPGSVDTAGADRLVAAFVAGTAFADEGSGIGELREADDGWLPIDHAPKDGTSVLVVVASTSANTTYGENGYRYVMQASFEDDMWLCADCSRLENSCWTVTHFRALPAPPNIDRSGLAQEVE